MAKSTHLYEVLFRFDENGLKGSHAIFIDRFTDDETGDLITEQTRPAMPVRDSAEAVSLVGQSISDFSSQIGSLQKDIRDKEKSIESLKKSEKSKPQSSDIENRLQALEAALKVKP